MPRRSPRFIDLQVLAELAQIAPDVKRGILKYATRRARMLADAGYPVASNEPSILVADAIADTLTGVVIWDRRYRLGYHLCSVVRTRRIGCCASQDSGEEEKTILTGHPSENDLRKERHLPARIGDMGIDRRPDVPL